MGKIGTYSIDAIPTVSDKVIGTDTQDLNLTKNYLISDILELGRYLDYLLLDASATYETTGNVIEAITNPDQTYTLPPAEDVTGKSFTLLSSVSGTTTLAADGGDLINGVSSMDITENGWITVVSNGTGWKVKSSSNG